MGDGHIWIRRRENIFRKTVFRLDTLKRVLECSWKCQRGQGWVKDLSKGYSSLVKMAEDSRIIFRTLWLCLKLMFCIKIVFVVWYMRINENKCDQKSKIKQWQSLHRNLIETKTNWHVTKRLYFLQKMVGSLCSNIIWGFEKPEAHNTFISKKWQGRTKILSHNTEQSLINKYIQNLQFQTKNCS